MSLHLKTKIKKIKPRTAGMSKLLKKLQCIIVGKICIIQIDHNLYQVKHFQNNVGNFSTQFYLLTSNATFQQFCHQIFTDGVEEKSTGNKNVGEKKLENISNLLNIAKK